MRRILVCMIGVTLCVFTTGQPVITNSGKNVFQALAKGWNTWDTYSQLSYASLPSGIDINLAFREYKNGDILRNPQMYQSGQRMILGAHSDDGSYTELKLEWKGMIFKIQTASDHDHFIALISPLKTDSLKAPILIAEAGILWQLPGTVSKSADNITWTTPSCTTSLFSTGYSVRDPYLNTGTAYNAYRLNGEIGLSTGRPYTIMEIKAILNVQSNRLAKQKRDYGPLSEIFDAMQSSIAWNTVYDPLNKRVITPVSRSWNTWHGGYVLFEWDNYFAAYMCSLFNKNLAYSNAIAITNEITEAGFIPNFSDALMKSRDRSEPPVGAFCVREIYRQYREKWFLAAVFDKLLSWNRWWATKRDIEGLLVYGSNQYKPTVNNYWETAESGVNRRQGASFESGMDNAPMYFDTPFDSASGLLQLWDVGLNSLYIQDCNALADIANELGKKNEYEELVKRGKKYQDNLNRLWDETTGIYRNKRTDNLEFSDRISPTSFYPLLTDAPDTRMINRMLKEHFYNPDEFYGQWMIPAVPRNDTCFSKQDYWQGRIWGPLNFLVYLGLRRHHLIDAKTEILEKSKAILLKNWEEHHFVCENYNAISGRGGEKGSASDPFYHWGALLGFMQFIEKGQMAAPATGLK